MSTTVETTRPTTSQPARTERSGSSQFTRRKVVGYLVTLLTWVLVFLFFFPVLWMIITSFKTEGQAASFPPQFFFTPTLDGYAAVFDRGMGLYLLNSFFVAVLSTVVVMLLAIPAAYALSVRPIGRWQDALFFFISTKFMPVAASIIPVFLLLRSVNLLDNLWSLGLLYLGVNLPLAVWMMRSFFAEVPIAVVEAAQIDGASYSRELWRVSLPIVAPGCRGGRADLLHLRLERVLPRQPAHRRGRPDHPTVPGQLRRRPRPVPGDPVGGLDHRRAAGDRRRLAGPEAAGPRPGHGRGQVAGPSPSTFRSPPTY